jgi:hypothetical protein
MDCILDVFLYINSSYFSIKYALALAPALCHEYYLKIFLLHYMLSPGLRNFIPIPFLLTIPM